MAKILIVGSGDIGGRLAKILIQKGHVVVGLRRTPPINPSPQMLTFLADVTLPQDLSNLDSDFEQVFFAIAPDKRDEVHYRSIYEAGIQNLLAYFSRHQAQAHWIFISSTRVYGQNRGEWVDESSVTEPDSRTGQILCRAEERILAENRQNVIVRFSGIYGPGRERLLRIAHNKEAIQSDPPYYTNRIHQEDCAGILAFLFERRLAGQSLAQCYLASDDEPAPLHEVISWLSKQMKVGDGARGKNGRAHSQNKRCHNERIKSLGYVFKFPNYQSGYQPLIRAC